MAERIEVHEVGLRDGLQNIKTVVPTDLKLAWIKAEAAAGVREIEVCSFVPPKLLPQFADAEEVTRRALQIPGLTVAALMPNLKGAERGAALGVHKLNYVVSVSESHNLNNVRRSTAESLADLQRIAEFLRGIERPSARSCRRACHRVRLHHRGQRAARPRGELRRAGRGDRRRRDHARRHGRLRQPGAVRTLFKRVRKAVGQAPAAGALPRHARARPRQCGRRDRGRRARASMPRSAGSAAVPFAPGATGNIVIEDVVFLPSRWASTPASISRS